MPDEVSFSLVKPYKVCAAKTRAGGVCQKPAMPNGRCRFHGGMSTGPKTLKSGGKYSKFLPVRLAHSYQEAINDAELISVRDDVALVQSLIIESMKGIDMEQCQATWEALEKKAQRFRNEPEDTKKKSIAYDICTTIDEGVAVWKQVAVAMGYIEMKRKLSETESKRMKDVSESLNAKQAMVLVAALAAAAREVFGKYPDEYDEFTKRVATIIGNR